MGERKVCLPSVTLKYYCLVFRTKVRTIETLDMVWRTLRILELVRRTFNLYDDEDCVPSLLQLLYYNIVHGTCQGPCILPELFTIDNSNNNREYKKYQNN